MRHQGWVVRNIKGCPICDAATQLQDCSKACALPVALHGPPPSCSPKVPTPAAQQQRAAGAGCCPAVQRGQLCHHLRHAATAVAG